ncbi:MAG: type VII toxin-antitoxin system MntA family adenylyltransferase antitoxin [Acidimicrobiales bacterium]
MEVPEAVRLALRQAGVAVTWMFGSQVTGTAGPRSDIDLALLTADDRPPLDLLELSQLTGILEDLLPAAVDLVDFRRASLELQARIVLTGRVVLSDDEALRVQTVVLTQSRWEDVRPGLRVMDRAFLSAVAENGLVSSGAIEGAAPGSS